MLKGENQSVLRVNKWQTRVLRVIQKNPVEFEYRSTLFRVFDGIESNHDAAVP